MKTLWDIIQATDIEIRTYKDIKLDPELRGEIAGHPVIITAVLERTAVVHPNDVTNKFVAALGSVRVKEEDIIWVDKSKDEQRIAKSRSIGRAFGVIARSKGYRAFRNL